MTPMRLSGMRKAHGYNQKVLINRFDAQLCCAHNWVKKHDIEICTTCNATCKRDTDGLIETYDIKGVKL